MWWIFIFFRNLVNFRLFNLSYNAHRIAYLNGLWKCSKKSAIFNRHIWFEVRNVLYFFLRENTNGAIEAKWNLFMSIKSIKTFDEMISAKQMAWILLFYKFDHILFTRCDTFHTLLNKCGTFVPKKCGKQNEKCN